MIYYGYGDGLKSLIAGDEWIFCVNGNSYKFNTTAIGDFEAFTSKDACLTDGRCTTEGIGYNTDAVYTSCGTNTYANGYINTVGKNIVKIVAVNNTTVSFVKSDLYVTGCFVDGSSSDACCPETNTLLNSILTAVQSMSIGDITVEVDDIEELLQTMIDNNIVCCDNTNTMLNNILSQLTTIGVDLTAVLTSLNNILLQLVDINTELDAVNVNLNTISVNQLDQTTLLTHIDTDLHTTNTTLSDILLELQKQKDFEPILLLDCDSTPYIMHRVYDQTTGTYSIVYTDTSGVAYIPSCANPVVSTDIELLTDCYEVIVPFGIYNLGDKLKRVMFVDVNTQVVIATLYFDNAGAVVAPLASDIAPCKEAITTTFDYCYKAIASTSPFYNIDDTVVVRVFVDVATDTIVDTVIFNHTQKTVVPTGDYVPSEFTDCVEEPAKDYEHRSVCFYDATAGAQCLTEHTEYMNGTVNRIFYTDNTGTEVTPIGSVCTRHIVSSQIIEINNTTDTLFVPNSTNTNHIEVQFFKENTQSNLTTIQGAFRYGGGSVRVSNYFETEDDSEISSLILRTNTEPVGYAHVYEYFVPKCINVYNYNK